MWLCQHFPPPACTPALGGATGWVLIGYLTSDSKYSLDSWVHRAPWTDWIGTLYAFLKPITLIQCSAPTCQGRGSWSRLRWWQWWWHRHGSWRWRPDICHQFASTPEEIHAASTISQCLAEAFKRNQNPPIPGKNEVLSVPLVFHMDSIWTPLDYQPNFSGTSEST